MCAKKLAVLLCAAALFPVQTLADTHPAVNRVIVQQSLQNQMQNQLNTQQTQLQTQQDAARASIQYQTQQQMLQLQYLLLQQQLEVMHLRLRAHAQSGARRWSDRGRHPHR